MSQSPIIDFFNIFNPNKQQLDQEKLKQQQLKQQKLNQELIQAISDKKDLAVIEEIIKKGANVNCADKNGWTPLHWA